MRPVSPQCPVRFGGAFLDHPDWKLNPAGRVELNATATEMTIMGERGRGGQRRPVALKLPARFIVNVLVDQAAVHFYVKDRQDHLSPQSFILIFEAEADARTFAELLPTVWVQETAHSATYPTVVPRPSSGRFLTSPALVLVACLLLGTAGGLLLSSTHLEAGKSAFAAAAEQWGHHGAAIHAGDAWRLLTSLFFHASLPDLALQVGGLVWLGARLHRVLGTLVWWFVFFGAGVGGGMVTLFWQHEAVWTTGAGSGIQGLMGGAITTLLLTQRAGGRIPRTLWRDLLIFEAVAVVMEWIQPGDTWGGLIGGLAVGAGMGWLSWREPQVGQDLPPRVGRALVAGLLVIGTAWGVMPRFDYRPDDEQRLSRWLADFETEEVERRNRWAELDEQYRGKSIEATAFAFETQRLIEFYNDEEKVLEALPLADGLRSDLKRKETLARIRERREQAQVAAQALQEIQALRALARRHWQQLQDLAVDPSLKAAVQRQLEAARSALVTTELTTEWALAERGQILLEWASWETEQNKRPE